MKDMTRQEALALLLAARHDPELRDREDVAHARQLVEANPELKAEYQAEVQAYKDHGALLTRYARLPAAARDRIRTALRADAGSGHSAPAGDDTAEVKVIPLPRRWAPKLAAAAAILLLGVGGGLWLSRESARAPAGAAAQQPASLHEFETYAAHIVARGVDLQIRSRSLEDIRGWLAEQDPETVVHDDVEALAGLPTVGCTLYEWGGEPVTMVCFETADHEIVHLFSVSREAISEVGRTGLPRTIAKHETLAWVEGDRAYVMVSHEAGQELPVRPG